MSLIILFRWLESRFYPYQGQLHLDAVRYQRNPDEDYFASMAGKDIAKIASFIATENTLRDECFQYGLKYEEPNTSESDYNRRARLNARLRKKKS